MRALLQVNDPAVKSAEGYDINFATNTLGAFAMAYLLKDVLVKSAPARIINVSSAGMYPGGYASPSQARTDPWPARRIRHSTPARTC